MSKFVLTDEAIGMAAELAMDSEIDSLPRPSQFQWEFSPEFEAKMEKLLRRERLRAGMRRGMRSVAAVFLFFVMGVSVFLWANPEARADFYVWVREVYESSIVYRYAGKPEAHTELPEVELTWIPEGYVEVGSDGDETSRIIVYQNAEGEMFIFDCMLVQEGMHTEVFLDGNAYELKELKIEGMRAELYVPANLEESSILMWVDTEKGITYSINANLEESVILNIAEGVKLFN